MADGDDSTAPSADAILSKPMVRAGTIQQVVGRGLRGFVYSLFIFIVAIATGFIRIIQNFFRGVAGGVGDIIANFLGGMATLIEIGAIRTANNFLLPGPFGFVEALAWTFVGMFVVQQMFDYFDTDIPGLPGANVIPFFGDEEGGDD